MRRETPSRAYRIEETPKGTQLEKVSMYSCMYSLKRYRKHSACQQELRRRSPRKCSRVRTLPFSLGSESDDSS
jgi:hypothetical protein